MHFAVCISSFWLIKCIYLKTVLKRIRRFMPLIIYLIKAFTLKTCIYIYREINRNYVIFAFVCYKSSQNMKLYWILCTAILLIGICVPCEGFLSQGPFQDFIDNYVDIEKFKQEGIRSLNSTAMKHIWDYFKSKFRRHYSTTG